MDLGISGRTAIVCASSRGLGYACAEALAREGVAVILNGLDPARLEAAAARLGAETGAVVTPVRADINTEAGRATLIAAAPEADILINNNTGPEPGDFQSYGYDEWNRALEAHFLSALFLIKALLPGMRARGFGRFVNIASALVKSPRNPEMTLSIATRTALVAACRPLARPAIADNVTINTVLPERIDTDRQRFMAERMMKKDGIDMEEARRRIADSLPAKRMGRPEEFGSVCAFLCAANSGFVTGHVLNVDGGFRAAGVLYDPAEGS